MSHAAVEAVWRIESPRLIAGLARMTRDVGIAEDLAQDALVAALERWPRDGVPDNPGAWLMTTAKHRAIDLIRRSQRGRDKEEELARTLTLSAPVRHEEEGADLLRLIFTCCHPSLSREAQVALTLKLVGGLTTPEIARAFLVPEATVAQRIVRAKRTLTAERAGFEAPDPGELDARTVAVLEVIYLIFNEGYSATAGDDWLRPELCADALRLGRVLAGLAPRRGSRTRRAHGAAGVADPRADRARRRTCPPRRAGPRALGSAAHPAGPRGADAGRGARGPARAVHAAGRDRGVSRAGPPR